VRLALGSPHAAEHSRLSTCHTPADSLHRLSAGPSPAGLRSALHRWISGHLHVTDPDTDDPAAPGCGSL